MKVVLHIFCWILAAYCIYFPFSYFQKDADKMEVNLSHILVKTQEEAIEAKRKIDEGEKSFEELAKEISECPSKEQNGNLGFYERGRVLPPIENYAFKADKQAISEPIETTEGWHLVKVNDIKYFSSKENF